MSFAAAKPTSFVVCTPYLSLYLSLSHFLTSAAGDCGSETKAFWLVPLRSLFPLILENGLYALELGIAHAAGD